MRRAVTLATLLILAGAAVHATPPAVPSLREVWESVRGKCGILTEEDGFYQMSVDTLDPQMTQHCVISVGADAILFGPSRKGIVIDSPQQYLVVPTARIVLSIRK